MADKLDFIISAYEAARTEIVERIKLRDRIIVAYIAGAVGFLGTAVGFQLDDSTRIRLFCVMPLVSLIVAAYIAEQTRMIHALAEYVRKEITNSIKDLGLSLTHWDLVSAQYRDPRRFSQAIMYILAVHSGTLICFVFATVIYLRSVQDNRFELFFLFGALIMMLFAMIFSWSGMRHRFQAHTRFRS